MSIWGRRKKTLCLSEGEKKKRPKASEQHSPAFYVTYIVFCGALFLIPGAANLLTH